MKKKMLGIFVCTLLIATAISVVGNTNHPVNIKTLLLDQKTYIKFIPGELIVKLSKDTTISSSSLKAHNEKYQVSSIEKIFRNAENTILDNIYVLSVPEDSDIMSIVCDYASNPDVVYAEPNYIGYLPIIPNDEYFPYQWPLNNSGQYGGNPDCDIDAIEAWDIEKGDSNVVIASIDSGVDYNHVDLADNIWINDDEIPGNGIDDDDNGYIDDIVGWDFCDNDSDPMDEYSNPQYGHGTRCAGIHSAITDNIIGLASINWYSKTMVVRCYAGPPMSQVLYSKGIKYAADNAADIINVESQFPNYQNLLKDAVDYAYNKGIFVLAAAGNYNSSIPRYPAGLENVTAVAATNQRDERCDEDDWGPGYGSNYGEWVDVAAPGNGLWVLWPNDQYIFMPGGGTSLAAPHVAGLAALLLSRNPSLSPDEVKSLICENVDPYNSTEYIGSGRINADKALKSLLYGNLYCEGDLAFGNVPAGATLTGSFTVQNVGYGLLDWKITDEPTWGEWTFDPEEGDDLPPGTPITVQVTVVAPNKKDDYTGTIKIENMENPDDNCIIDVSMTTPRSKAFNFNFPILSWLFERFPNAFPILRHMLGL